MVVFEEGTSLEAMGSGETRRDLISTCFGPMMPAVNAVYFSRYQVERSIRAHYHLVSQSMHFDEISHKSVTFHKFGKNGTDE